MSKQVRPNRGVTKQDQKLIEAYVDGEADDSTLRELIKRLDGSAELRDLLARAVVTDRLLRAEGHGAVSAGAIVAYVRRAIAAESGGVAAVREPGSGGVRGVAVAGVSRRRVRLPSSLAAGLAVAGLVAVVMFVAIRAWRESPGMPGRHGPDGSVGAAPGAGTAAVRVGPVAGAATGKTARAGESVLLVETPSTGSSLMAYKPLSPTLPDVDEVPAPPGDGSGEAGFVAPPAGWVKEGERWWERHLEKQATDPGRKRKPMLPVLIAKVRFPELSHWNVTPGDVDRLLDEAAERLHVRYDSTVIALDGDIDPVRYPVLYLSGHYRFAFDRPRRQALRSYLLRGGTLVFNSGLGSAPFLDSARRELAAILPESPVHRLEPDHPLFYAIYRLDQEGDVPGRRRARQNAGGPLLEGVTLSCRTAAFISSWDMAAGWLGRETSAGQAYPQDEAVRLGINLVSYITSMRGWSKKMALAASFDTESSRTTMAVGQVIYDGVWQTRYAALPMLLHTFNRRTEIQVQLQPHAMRFTDPGLFDTPMLYLTGHDTFSLSSAERERLKQYLLNGGFLFAEACCGRKGFDRSFRALMDELLPDSPLVRIPADDMLYAAPNKITRVGVTPVLAEAYGSAWMPPALEGVRHRGHFVVVYSAFGLAGGWEMASWPYTRGYDEVSAIRLGQNILFYAVTQ